jgi:hypothetical protein
MTTWQLALVASLAMIAQDLLLTWLTQAEARNRWALAGFLDCGGFLAQVTTYGVSIDAIVTHGLGSRTLIVLGALTVSNFIGTGLGTLLGSKWIHAASVVREAP